ncbi:uncharacterized protein PG986_014768 [Apiospora aurea]|uniref:Uncharacterized protein n=1 Tax=Apiospora aurea TaxID=335848 RepID=A0ABR1PUF4_9PEZI
MDNPNSTISGDFSRMDTAVSTYINGIVDTTINPALFPLLSRAGEVSSSFTAEQEDIASGVTLNSCESANAVYGCGAGQNEIERGIRETPEARMTALPSARESLGKKYGRWTDLHQYLLRPTRRKTRDRNEPS